MLPGLIDRTANARTRARLLSQVTQVMVPHYPDFNLASYMTRKLRCALDYKYWCDVSNYET